MRMHDFQIVDDYNNAQISASKNHKESDGMPLI